MRFSMRGWHSVRNGARDTPRPRRVSVNDFLAYNLDVFRRANAAGRAGDHEQAKAILDTIGWPPPED